MKTFELKEVVEFIREQPDDKQVNMLEGYNDSFCVGCLLVQFGREKGIEFSDALVDGSFMVYNPSIERVAKIEGLDYQNTVFDLFGSKTIGNTYGELKEQLKYED